MSDAVSTLLDAILGEPAERRTVALEAACLRHPELASSLRSRFHIVASLGLLEDRDGPGLSVPERLGDFRLLDRLGGGGMGVVYRAIQESLGREVAVKLVRPELLLFERGRARFLREVEAVARLSHPGIVPIHSFGEAQGLPFFAMERLRGCSVAEVITELAEQPPALRSGADWGTVVQRRSGLPDTRPAFGDSWIAACVRIVLQVAEALGHAHAHGVVHRDVKPSNIMLTTDARVLLVDFGIAGAEGSQPLTRSGSQLGSLPYSAPEQLKGEWSRVDGRADLYALGCVLYELLAGAPPFRGDNPQALLHQALLREPPDLRRANANVPADLAAIVERLLEKDPARRYRDAGAVVADLRAFLAWRPVSVRRTGAVGRFLRWRRREPWRAGLLLTAAAALLLVSGFSGYLVRRWPEIAAGRTALRADAVELLLAEGFTEIANGQQERARTVLARALLLLPDSPEANAALLLASSRPATQETPVPASAPAADPVALFVHGMALAARVGRHDAEGGRAAAARFADAVTLAPRARLLLTIGLAYGAELSGDEAMARRAALALETLWPQAAIAHYWAGRTLLAHDPAAAVAALRQATALDPSLASAWSDLGVAEQRAGDASSAQQAYERALVLEPCNGRALLDLALLHLAAGRAEAAQAASLRAVECAPSLPGAHYTRGLVLLAAGDAEQALASFRQTVALASDYAEAWNNIGALLSRAEDGRGAATAFRRYAALRPDVPQAHHNLALALWQTGDLRGAARALQRVVELSPRDAEAHEHLCTLLGHLGEAEALQRERARFAGR